MKGIRGLFIFILGIIGGLLISKFLFNPLIGDHLIKGNINNVSYYENKYSRFESVDSILKSQYYDYTGFDQSLMIKNAIKGYVDSIGDPYTVYMDADTNSGFMNDLEGEDHFEGIGAVVSKKDYYILIEEIIKDSPSFRAGLKPLDRIVKIDNEYVQDESLNDSVNRMKGPKGSSVLITIERVDGDNSEVMEFNVVRDVIDVPSLSLKTFDVGEKNIAYMEISIIGEETDNILQNEIKNLNTGDIDGVIIDLRGNGGGLMDVGVKIASHFIPKGKVVVQSKYRGFTDDIYYSKGYGEFEGKKVVVLVDGLTASAGEIIALALHEQVDATILGTTTFGKGTIQTLYDFTDGDCLKYTIGKRFSPNGLTIDKSGITPDIYVEFDGTGYLNDNIDNQLEEAKNLFK